jgi:hypothetical protein
MLEELPNFICSHGNISFLWNEKEVRKSKESCLGKGRFLYWCILLRFGNILKLMPKGAPSFGECEIWEPPLQNSPLRKALCCSSKNVGEN